MMYYLGLLTTDFQSPEYLGATYQQQSVWTRLLAFCCSNENSGRVAGARRWNPRQWLAANIMPDELGDPCDLYRWDGDDLVVWGYKLHQQQKTQDLRQRGKRAADARWHGHEPNADTGSMPNGIPNGNAKGQCQEMRREEKERRGEEPTPPPSPPPDGADGGSVEVQDEYIPDTESGTEDSAEDVRSTCRPSAREEQRTSKPPPPKPELEKGADPDFEVFWKAYPKKVKRADSEKAWKQTAKVRPPLAELLEIVQGWCRSAQWTKDGGEFIPAAAGWLRGKRWEDELSKRRPAQAGSMVSAGAHTPDETPPWDAADVSAHDGTPEWDAYYDAMEAAHGTHNCRWPRFEAWLAEQSAAPAPETPEPEPALEASDSETPTAAPERPKPPPIRHPLARLQARRSP